MLRWSVMALLAHPHIAHVCVGVQADDPWAASSLDGLDRTSIRPTAGTTRALTVLGTLNALFDDGTLRPEDWVLVHDAARPGLPLTCLEQLVQVCVSRDCGGLLAMRATDTVKLACAHTSSDTTSQIQETINRDRVWLAQTPQMFKALLLREALVDAIAAGYEVTDESSAVERKGLPSLLVQGDVANFKVTWPDDFEMIERYIK